MTKLIQAKSTLAQSQGKKKLSVQIIGDKRTNKVMVFAPKSEIQEYITTIQELDEKIEAPSTGKFHIIKLQNVKAEDLGPKLNEMLTGNQVQGTGSTSGSGTNPAKKKVQTRITAEPKSNSLIIQAEPEEYKKIQNLVLQLDISPPQVLIEAHIFEVEDSRSLNIGAEIATYDPSVPTELRGAGATSFGLSQVTIDPANPNRIQRIPIIGQGVFGALHKGGFDRLPLMISLLGTDRNTNILAEPFAVTNDNEEAIFKDETEIPTLQQNSGASNVNFTTQQGSVTASTSLTITPHISPKDLLRLDIDLQIEDFAAQAVISNTTPPKTKRSYKGSVTVKNGKFLVIGGLSRKDYTETISKVPILGDIPILGWLFSNRTKTKRNLNVYIFIRAYVLRKGSGKADIVTKYMKKNAEKASNYKFREDYGADVSEGAVKEKVRQLLFDSEENLLGK